MNPPAANCARLSKLAHSAMERRDGVVLLFVANQFFAIQEFHRAELCLLAALAIDPEATSAREALAATYEQTGRLEEAKRQCDLVYSKQWCITDRTQAHTDATVLLAMYPGDGHIPPTYLLPPGRFTKVRCMLAYARFDADTRLPDHDVIFNLLGDPDWLGPGDHRLAELVKHSGRPLMNAAPAVGLTRRDRLPQRLAGIPFIDVPRVHRLELEEGQTRDTARELARLQAVFPLLLRPARTHGGKGMLLALDAAGLAQAPIERELYATEYRDYRSADGYYRKYRVIFVDRRPYPYHLAISKQWLVHYFSAEMLEAPWKLEEEQRFLEQPAAVLGAQAFGALEEIGRRLDLEYAGIDFSILPDGTLLVFEANATMLVHPEDPSGVLAHKNPHVDAIVRAFGDLVLERARR